MRNSLEKGAPIMMGNVFFHLFRIQTKEREFFGGRAQGSSLAIFELVLWNMSFAELGGLIRKTWLSFCSVGFFHSVRIYMLLQYLSFSEVTSPVLRTNSNLVGFEQSCNA